MFNIKESKVRVNDMDFDYISFGKVKKNLVIIQGLNTNGIKGSSLMLSLMYRKFTKDYKVYLFERRMNIDSNITVKDFADDYALIMQELGIENADIFGVSQGGMIAQHLAVLYPEVIDKLVLVVTVPYCNENTKQLLNNWIQYVENDDYKQLMDENIKMMYTDKYYQANKWMIPIVAKFSKPKSPQRFITMAKACIEHHCDPNLIKVPTLIIAGRKDDTLGVEGSIELNHHITGSELKIYEDYGHAVYDEAKDFDQTIIDYLTI